MLWQLEHTYYHQTEGSLTCIIGDTSERQPISFQIIYMYTQNNIKQDPCANAGKTKHTY